MILKWLDTSEVDALADRLASELVERIPPTSVEARGKKADVTRIKSKEAILRQAREFTSSNRLNVYKKARLANRFKWALREAGYPKMLVDEMAFELASVMATTKNTSG